MQMFQSGYNPKLCASTAFYECRNNMFFKNLSLFVFARHCPRSVEIHDLLLPTGKRNGNFLSRQKVSQDNVSSTVWYRNSSFTVQFLFRRNILLLEFRFPFYLKEI